MLTRRFTPGCSVLPPPLCADAPERQGPAMNLRALHLKALLFLGLWHAGRRSLASSPQLQDQPKKIGERAPQGNIRTPEKQLLCLPGFSCSPGCQRAFMEKEQTCTMTPHCGCDPRTRALE